MTVEQLRTKRDQILQRIGVARTQFGERSIQYSDAKEALSLLDAEIAKVEAETTTPNARVTYASFSEE